MSKERPFLLRGLTLAAAVTAGVGLMAAAPSAADRGEYSGYDDGYGKPRDHDRRAARRLEEAGTIQGLETILATVREHRPGRVLEVELEYEYREPLYEVTVLDEGGVVWEVKVDAATGAFLGQERDDWD
jgi:uncharacterized membrane protein YkoI